MTSSFTGYPNISRAAKARALVQAGIALNMTEAYEMLEDMGE